jgi:hypothetical protein
MNPIWIAFILLSYFGLLLLISWLTSKGADNAGFSSVTENRPGTLLRSE